MQITITNTDIMNMSNDCPRCPSDTIISLILSKKGAPMIGVFNPVPNTVDYIWERINCPLSCNIIFNIKKKDN